MIQDTHEVAESYYKEKEEYVARRAQLVEAVEQKRNGRMTVAVFEALKNHKNS